MKNKWLNYILTKTLSIYSETLLNEIVNKM